MEEWRDIPGWEGLYQASNLGRVRSLPRTVEEPSRHGGIRKRSYPSRILKPWLAGLGYEYVQLGKGGHSTVHRVVCLAFHGKPPCDGLDVAHYDGDRRNNRPENLRWATRSENIADSVRHGTSKLVQFRTDGHVPRKPQVAGRRGELSHFAKLNRVTAAEIRTLYATGSYSMASLASRYAVGKSTISRIIRNKVWAE